MILYLAGQASEVKNMKFRKEYEHVLFSRFVYSKRNFASLIRRKQRELDKGKKK